MIRLDLQPEIEAQLAAEAQAQSMPIDRYIEEIIASHAGFINWPGERQLQQNLKQGQREIAKGNTRPAREVFAELGN